jgi:hypothetical protein
VFAKSLLSTGRGPPPNPLSFTGASSSSYTGAELDIQLAELTALEENGWAGWVSPVDDDDEQHDDEEVPEEVPDEETGVPAPRRRPAVGPGGRRCIVATTCSSGAHLRFSRRNMFERSSSPLQWEHISMTAIVSNHSGQLSS